MNLILNLKQTVFLLLCAGMLAAGFQSCTKDDDMKADGKVTISGKWLLTAQTYKIISNGNTILDQKPTQFNGAYYNFNADGSMEAKSIDTDKSFVMKYTLEGDLLTLIHTESKDHFESKELLRVTKLTKTDLHLSLTPKDNEPYLTAPDGSYVELDFVKQP